MIPKQIHQCWFGSALDTERQNSVNSLRNLNKGWTHTLWDDAAAKRFINDVYGWYVTDLYNSINPNYYAARADLFRYLLMYDRGGVYLDVKSLYTKPLDSFINPNDEYILTGNGYEWHQWHIMCVPKHEFLTRVIGKVFANIERYDMRSDGVGDRAVVKITGPKPYTEGVNAALPYCEYRHVKPYPHRLVYDTLGSERRRADPKHYSNQSEPLICR